MKGAPVPCESTQVFTTIKRNFYEDPKKQELDIDDDYSNCTCDANGVPGGHALVSSGTGCDPSHCMHAIQMIECTK